MTHSGHWLVLDFATFRRVGLPLDHEALGFCNLLEPMFNLPGLDDVEEIVINREVVEDEERAQPLYIYTDRREDVGSSSA